MTFCCWATSFSVSLTTFSVITPQWFKPLRDKLNYDHLKWNTSFSTRPATNSHLVSESQGVDWELKLSFFVKEPHSKVLEHHLIFIRIFGLSFFLPTLSKSVFIIERQGIESLLPLQNIYIHTHLLIQKYCSILRCSFPKEIQRPGLEYFRLRFLVDSARRA